jgi:integrase
MARKGWGAMRKGVITQRFVERLEAPKEGNRIEWDEVVAGFGARITSTGVVAFVLQYSIHGRDRRYTIGRWPEWSADAARNEALDLRRDIAQGKDPLHEKELSRNERTVSELAKEYLERHAEVHKRASTLRNDRQMLKGLIEPRIGQLSLSAVGRRDIESLHQSLKATPYRANRMLSLLSSMFNKAVDWRWLVASPAKKIRRYHEDRREAWLTAEQLTALDKALDDYGKDSADAIRLLILTGSRENEVLGAEWEQFDLERAVWTKPSHHTKEKKIEHVPLSSAALLVLKRMNEKKRDKFLFPGHGTKKARRSIRRPWVQACRMAGLATPYTIPGKRGKELTRWRPIIRVHDLRHTYASHLVSSGVSLPVVGKLLGHTMPSTTARYAHLADESLRTATNGFAAILYPQPEVKAPAKGKRHRHLSA